MPLVEVDLRKPLEPLRWAVEGLLLRGYLNTVASLPGEGKTAVLTGLAWQASRPDGGNFLGHRVAPGTTLYVDYDAPGDGRSIRYWLERHRHASPDGELDRVVVLEPDHDTYGLAETELAELSKVAKTTRARLIIIDSFMAAFPSTDPVKLTQVQAPLWYLRRLAFETDAAVVLLDHLPKPTGGEKPGARGVLGSVAKPAQARSVHVLTRVPEAEAGGRHLLRWTCTKMSYAARPEPFGLELRFDDQRVYIQPTTLPDGAPGTKTERAAQLMRAHLEASQGQVAPRKDLLRLAVQEGDLSQRIAEDALTNLLNDMGSAVERVTLSGRGKPQGYRLRPELEDALTLEGTLRQMPNEAS